jgi:hypothetical protein
MTSSSNLLRNFVVIFFLIIQYYSPAQTTYHNDQLLKTWKLQSMTRADGTPYVKIEELPYELITFKNDSVWERKLSQNKFEGIWYHYGPDMLIIIATNFNGIQNELSGRKTYWKIKEITSTLLVLIFQEREGNDITYTYHSYSGN